MRLKSKLTDAEGELLTIGLDRGERIVLMVEIDGIRELYMYDSLDGLNEEWKDADDRTVH